MEDKNITVDDFIKAKEWFDNQPIPNLLFEEIPMIMACGYVDYDMNRAILISKIEQLKNI